MSKISVVIPCYNYGQFLSQAVDSVLASDFEDFEIIIVDDGSTDEQTGQVLREFNRPKTKIIFQKNQGLSTARNNGIKKSQGTYILCLDADDTIEPQYLSKALEILEKNEKIGFVTPWVNVFGDENYIWKTKKFDLQTAKYINYICAGAIFRKKCWQKVGGYKVNMKYGYEDWDFWLSIGEDGYNGEVIEMPLFNHRKHGKTMTKTAFEKSKILLYQLQQNHPDLFSNFDLKKIKLRFWIKSFIPYSWQIFYKQIKQKELLSKVTVVVSEDLEIIDNHDLKILCKNFMTEEIDLNFLQAIKDPYVVFVNQPRIKVKVLKKAIEILEKRKDLAFVYFKKNKKYNFYNFLNGEVINGPILFRVDVLKKLKNINFKSPATVLLSVILPLGELAEYGYYFSRKISDSVELGKIQKQQILEKFPHLFENMDYFRDKFSPPFSLTQGIKKKYWRLPLWFRQKVKIFFTFFHKPKIYLSNFNLPQQALPKVSIIVPVYNHFEYLRQCMDSALKQNYANCELIVVDDCSTEPQVKKILSEYENLPNIKVICNKENLHISKTLNIGVENASGQYLAFLDCDDMLLPYSISEIMKYILSREKKVYFVSSLTIVIDKKGREVMYVKRSEKPDIMQDMKANHLKVINKELFENIGLHDPSISGTQDYDLALKCDEKFYIDYLNKYLYKYREHEKTVSQSQLKFQQKKRDLLQFRSLKRRYYEKN